MVIKTTGLTLESEPVTVRLLDCSALDCPTVLAPTVLLRSDCLGAETASQAVLPALQLPVLCVRAAGGAVRMRSPGW